MASWSKQYQTDMDMVTDVKAIRRLLGWSQSDLARHLRRMPYEINRFETGKRVASVEMRKEIALFLYENRRALARLYAPLTDS